MVSTCFNPKIALQPTITSQILGFSWLNSSTVPVKNLHFLVAFWGLRMARNSPGRPWPRPPTCRPRAQQLWPPGGSDPERRRHGLHAGPGWWRVCGWENHQKMRGCSTGWWLVYLPLWKMMEFVNWDYERPNIWKKKVPNHQPVHLHHLIGGSFNPPEKYEFVRLDHPNYWGKEKMFQTTRFSPRFSVRMPAQFVERGNAVSGTSTGTFSAVQPSYCHMERPWAGYSVPQHLGHRDRPSVCWATVQPQPEHRSPTAMRPLA